MESKTCTAALLIAGPGHRLRPLTLARPKPLLPAGGISILAERPHKVGSGEFTAIS